MLIAGGTDAEDGAVSFRFRDGEQLNGVALDRALDQIADFVGRRANHSPSVADFEPAQALPEPPQAEEPAANAEQP